MHKTTTNASTPGSGRSAAGFTLMEIIVVLAVLGALAAMLAPVVFRYIDDANVARAQADVSTLAAGITKMYKDTGRWPFYKDGNDALAYTSGTDAALLTSNGATCTTGCTDATLPEDGTSGDLWALATAKKDNVANQLVTNTPFGSTASADVYATTGSRAWQGPYVDRVPATDPWGRSYVVNVANADPGVAASSQRWVIVISGGPDGTLETDPTAALFSNAVPVDDDIIARVR